MVLRIFSSFPLKLWKSSEASQFDTCKHDAYNGYAQFNKELGEITANYILWKRMYSFVDEVRQNSTSKQKTSVAKATESSVYVWSRACVVKLHKNLNK